MNRKDILAKAETIANLLQDANHIERETIMNIVENLSTNDRRINMQSKAKPAKTKPYNDEDED